MQNYKTPLGDVSTSTIQKIYDIVKIIIIVFTVLCVIGGIVLIAEGSQYRYKNWSMIAPGIVMMVIFPIISYVSIIISKIIFGLFYDIKVLRILKEEEKTKEN